MCRIKRRVNCHVSYQSSRLIVMCRIKRRVLVLCVDFERRHMTLDTIYDNKGRRLIRHMTIKSKCRAIVAQLSIVVFHFHPRHLRRLIRHMTMRHDIRHYIEQMSCNCQVSTGVLVKCYCSTGFKQKRCSMMDDEILRNL